MPEGEFEDMLKELLSRVDFSTGTEAFREQLLVQCLAALPHDADEEEDGSTGRELDDRNLAWLAAAGAPTPSPPTRPGK